MGTGIGAGVFVGGRLYRGAHNAAGRLGHFHVRGPEAPAGDGLGALERHAAGPAIARMVGSQAGFEAVWAAAAQGDPAASAAVDHAIETLALGLANAAMLLDPELIVLGGGIISQAGDAILASLRERISALLMPPVAPSLELSRLGTQAQLYGALRLAMGRRET